MYPRDYEIKIKIVDQDEKYTEELAKKLKKELLHNGKVIDIHHYEK